MENSRTSNTNEQENIELSCECQNGKGAESCSGDSICCQSISNVRETIRKYEPKNQVINVGQEIRRSSLGSIRSMKSGKSMINSQSQTIDTRKTKDTVNHHIVYEDQQTAIVHKEPIQEISPRKANTKITDQLKPQKIQQSNDESVQTTPKINSISNEKLLNNIKEKIFNKSLNDISYKSKTTIAKTSNGVRIITDIFFDSVVDFNWKASRIETDIPPSKILRDFQEINQYSRK